MSNERFVEMPEIVCKMAEQTARQNVREMTVDEVAAEIARHEGYDPERMIYASLGAANVRRPTPIKERYYSVAQALAKLGTIRIVEK